MKLKQKLSNSGSGSDRSVCLYSRVRLGDDGILGDGAEVPGLADVLGTVHEEVLDDHEKHLDVVPGEVVLALLLVAGETGAVVGSEVGLGGVNY